MNKYIPQLGVLIVWLALQAACTKDPISNLPEEDYTQGILICNEGLYPNGAGSISFFNRQTKTVSNQVFETVNNRVLGNTVQSVQTFSGKTYIVASSVGRIEVVNAQDFTSLATINNLQLPRYFLGIGSNKAYVTQWGNDGISGSVAVVNLQTYQIEKTIATAKGPEMVVQINNSVFIPCEGGYDYVNYDNKIAVIDANTDELITQIDVLEYPNSVVADANNNIWVLCGGIVTYNPDWSVNLAESTKGGLVKIDAATNTVISTLEFDDAGTAGSLTINTAKTILYYEYNGQIYAQPIANTTLNTQPLINHSYYGMGIDPIENILYGADAKDYQSNGSIIRHSLPDGTAIDTFTVGVIPNSGFYFGE